MPNGTYGGVRGKETKVGQKTFVSRPTRLFAAKIIPQFYVTKYLQINSRLVKFPEFDTILDKITL
jgi:hypothetical protein